MNICFWHLAPFNSAFSCMLLVCPLPSLWGLQAQTAFLYSVISLPGKGQESCQDPMEPMQCLSFCLRTLSWALGTVLLAQGTSTPATSEELCTLPGRAKHQPYFVYFFTIFCTNWWMSFQELPMLSDLKTKKTWLRGMRHLLAVGRLSASPVSSRLLSNSSPPCVAEGRHTPLAASLGHLGGDFPQCQWWGRWPSWLMCLGIRDSGWLTRLVDTQ